MKLALALAALLIPAAAQAETCSFNTSLGIATLELQEGGAMSLDFAGEAVDLKGCRYDDSFRRDSLRCTVILDGDTRLELYRAYFERRTPKYKTSMIIWKNVNSSRPSVENALGDCR